MEVSELDIMVAFDSMNISPASPDFFFRFELTQSNFGDLPRRN